jgi:acyl-CoA reductase-like NAD-dependent aldehyde dehydrogenase
MSSAAADFPERLATGNLDLELFYDGGYQRSRGTERIEIRSPATGERLGSAPAATASDVTAAVDAAAAAADSGVWSDLDPLDRGIVLNRIANAIAARIDDLAVLESSVTGRACREMRAQIGRLPDWFRYFGGIARGLEGSVPPFKGSYLSYTRHIPIGVVGILTPWNHPLLILVKKLAAALAAGNAVVVKPSELAPLSPLLLAEIASAAGLPRGILNVVTGDGPTAGQALCDAPRIGHLDVTGGNETGKHVALAAARRHVPATLELGGKAPVIVFGDAQLHEAVAGATFAAFVASGQTCVSGARILVEDSLYDAFAAAFVAKVQSLRLGHPLDPETDMGPVIGQRQFDRILSYVAIGLDEGARLVAGGSRAALGGKLADGFYIQPTVFADVRPSMRIAQEEIFGPVVTLSRFTSEAEAIAVANSTPFGLGASIWTNNVARAHRVAASIRAGIVWINDHHKNDPGAVWGGFGASGYGKDNGWTALREYSQVQSVVVRTSDTFADWFGSATDKRYG